VTAGAGDPARGAVDGRDVVMALDHGVVLLDERTRIVTCNRAAELLLGRRADDLRGRAPGELDLELLAADGSPLPLGAEPSLPGERRELVVGIRQPDGVRWLSVTAAPLDPAQLVVTLVDVSPAREREAALRELSELDDLTGLPNRRRFVDLLDRHLSSQRREDARGALLLIDLDRFKELNDTFGHAAGDRLLVQVAHAIRERLRADDVLARLGGDEFAVLLARAQRGGDSARRVRPRRRDPAQHAREPGGRGAARRPPGRAPRRGAGSRAVTARQRSYRGSASASVRCRRRPRGARP
jgi:GGDEF domain-containing protein